MKALAHAAHGGPEVLELVDLPEPEPGPLDVVVRVAATATNRLDVLQRAGWFTLPGFALPHVAGMDVAGTVHAVGTEVDGLAVGDRVVVDPSMVGVPDGAAYAGMGDVYGVLGIIGATLPGGYAELCLAPASHVHPVPDHISLEDAASVPTAYATAWHALVAVGRVQPGEVVLVHAAGSGVSSALIQLARARGATVLATASAAKLGWAGELGAEHACDNRSTDVAAWARERTDGRGVDLVVDHIGPALWQASLSSLRPRGRLVSCGNVTGDEVSHSLGQAFHMGLSIIGSDAYLPEEFGDVLDAVWNGGFRSIVTERHPLGAGGEAQQRLDDGLVTGKQLLLP